MTAAPRKLATIVALDVAGYSARTEADEAKTTAEVAALRQVIEGIAKVHGGRVFNTAGDGFMLEFASSLAAVEAANDLAQKCEPKVRVGVHLGDVVVQPNGDLLGHGVNVAARLMAKSDPGAALISADVRRTIRGPLAERLVSRGHIQLDKMTETIEAFALAAAAAAMVAAPPKSAEPLLAVLPFDNLSNDPEMQFFSDGVAEEILQSLMRGSGLSVIGRTSSFQFRGERKGEAARVLKATHVLDGAVRRSGSHMRVTVQLTESMNNKLLWTDRYDRDVSEVFAMQDDIAWRVSGALQQSLSRRAQNLSPIEPAAYDLYLRARSLVVREFTDADYRMAQSLLEQVVARAPGFSGGWAMLANARASLLPRDRDCIGEPAHDAAKAAAERALSLDDSCAEAYWTLAQLQPELSNHAEKLKLVDKAIELAPKDPLIAIYATHGYWTVGRIKHALAHSQRAAMLDSMSPFPVSFHAAVLLVAGQHRQSMSAIAEARRRFPDSATAFFCQWDILRQCGYLAEAEAMCEPGTPTPTGLRREDIEGMRNGIRLARMAWPEREPLARALIESTPRPIATPNLQFFAYLGFAEFALKELSNNLASGQLRNAWVFEGRGPGRAFGLSMFFGAIGTVLRRDPRFAKLCARVGLVDYWRTSGHWPDCANEVPYDFKSECEKAASELGKA